MKVKKNTIDIKAEFFLKNCECLIEKPTTCVCIVNINECIPPRNIGYTLAFFSIFIVLKYHQMFSNWDDLILKKSSRIRNTCTFKYIATKMLVDYSQELYQDIRYSRLLEIQSSVTLNEPDLQ